jgi:Zn-dependent protease
MNFFEQGIPLGRWFKITVVIHWLFVVYAASMIFQAPPGEQIATTIYIILLFGTVLMHEFGHALACQAVGGLALHIVLWPLGGIAFVKPPDNVRAWLITTACGPLVNAVLWPLFWVICHFGLPALAGHVDVQSAWFGWLTEGCYMMLEINRLLLLFNLIPAYPMDGGRLLQELLWLTIGYRASLQIAGMVGTVVGAGFVVLGLGLQEISVPVLGLTLGHRGEQEYLLAIIGVLCIMQSFGIYRRSQHIPTRRNP